MVRRLLLLFLLTSALAIPASLRAQNSAPNHEPVPPFEFYGGYSYVFSETHNATTNVITTNGLPGWDASLKVPVPFFPKWLGVKGDVSGSYYNSDNTNPNFKSNDALKEAMGYILGMGFAFKAKPEAFASSSCANKVVN